MAHPGGRPTKYRKEYCKALIEHMSQGLSFEAFAGACGVSKECLYEWTRVYPEFSDAKALAFEKNRLFWENLGIQNIINESYGNNQGSKSLNSSVYIFNMKNRFPKEWRDRKEIDAVVAESQSDVEAVRALTEELKKLKS